MLLLITSHFFSSQFLQYLLSWRGFHGNMCKGFHSLQRDGQMVDVTIAAGGKIFKAHKLVSIEEGFLLGDSDLNYTSSLTQVLSVCSPYFQRIFIEHPSTHPILFMTDVNSNHMAGLLDFMYSGQVGYSFAYYIAQYYFSSFFFFISFLPYHRQYLFLFDLFNFFAFSFLLFL